MSEKKLLWGQNSFIPPCPFYELQMDSSYLEHTQLEVVSFRLLDIFTKYMVVVPIQDNLEGDIAAGMIEDSKMAGEPGLLHMHDDTGLNTPWLFKGKGRSTLGTRGHPNLSEKAQ